MSVKEKSLVDRIGMSFYSCGCCCSQIYPCDSCIENTLKSNGLSLEYKERLKGLSHQDYSHCPPTYSPFHLEVKKIIRELSQQERKIK